MNDMVRMVRECIGRTDRTQLQNTLMRIPDKVCAIALRTLDEETRFTLFGLIAPMKADRIAAEMKLENRRRTNPVVQAKILKGFLSYFGEAESLTKPIYIRPRGASRS